MKRDELDFHAVRHEHIPIHDLLINWSRVVKVHATSGGNCSPLFRHYRTANYSFDLDDPDAARMGLGSDGAWVDDTPKRPPPDVQAGWRMEKAVSNLPDKHRVAIRWAYVHTWKPPMLVARRLAVSPNTLQDLIHDGRSMLRNRL